ncbi:Two-component sensor histidine kinase [Thermobacillus xylanilyticus]|jgi:two-component system phosphate regulon sensor histidine kinase PhoR|uniref:histidine kinase n=1 Tax=Thermobacillus xylanilyticus TaxID=76633 RepID=A0ABN7RVV7_THEXY|nr:ATP-binding protein [Thermobacillus xylanilyticus]CAG5084437.1 Two-component sensor histidine kinase [Thermobacillus xylanilyticus]
MNSFRSRLAAVMIGLVGMAVAAAGIYMAVTFERSHYDALRDNLVREIGLIEDAVDWHPAAGTDAYARFTERARHYRSITGARVTFIAGDGTVLGDSDHDPASMDNHLDRPEVAEAQRKGVGYDVRRSDTTHHNMMYVAVKREAGDADGFIRLALDVSEIEQGIRRLWFGLITGLLLLLAVAAAASWRIARGMTKPLEAVTRAAQRIRNMDYEARVEVDPRGEIGELGRAVNAMAESLQQQMVRIRQKESQLESVLDNMTSGIVMINRAGVILLLNRMAEELLGMPAHELLGRQYTEARQQYELVRLIGDALERREHLRDELTFYYPEERQIEINLVPIEGRDDSGGLLLVLQDVTAIRRLERMRSEFVANVSHELKTPIAAVKGFAETLLGGAGGDPETQRAFLKIIHDESDRLNRLVNDILELSKIESRRAPLLFSPVELGPFIGKTVELLAKEAERKNIRIETEVGDELYVEADEDRLRQIVVNVLSNAINYTPEGGRVRIQVEPVASGDGQIAEEDDYDAIRIRISDNGIGIPKKDLPRIFERFYRVDKARSRSSGGTGLGLSIVKHLVELHRGSIAVESTVGVGTTFTIELPVLQESAGDAGLFLQ